MSAQLDVLAVLDYAGAPDSPFCTCQDDAARRQVADARAAVAELIEQRDALVGVVFGLVQSLPKGPRALGSNAQAYVRDGATLACAIFDRADVDPEAFARYAKTLWGGEYRASLEELQARYATAMARVRGKASPSHHASHAP